MDGLLLQLLSTKLFPQPRWTSSCYTLRRALRCNSDGRAPTYNSYRRALPSTQMDELLLFTLTSPSLQLRWTGSHIQLLSTSSSLNLDGRAPAIHSDEPFAATQMDGLPPTTHIDELFPQPRWTSSYYSH